MPYDQYQNTISNKESEFNEAVAQIKRIGENWVLCHNFRRSGKLTQWNFVLDCIWMELYADSKSGDRKEFGAINKDFVDNKDKRNSLYYVLMKKEGFLRELQEKQKKGGKKKEDLRGL